MHSIQYIAGCLCTLLLLAAGCIDSASSGLEAWPDLDSQRANMEVKYRDEILHTEIRTFEEFRELESTADAGSGVYGSLNDRLERRSLLDARRRKWYVDNTPNLPVSTRDSILEGSIVIGMTQEQVLAGRGWPRSVNRTTTAFGTTEQWIYGYYIAEEYGVRYTHFGYFRNGLLTSWQDCDLK